MARAVALLLLAVFGLTEPPNAPDTTADFTVNSPAVRLPVKCQVPGVERRVLSIIHAFNTGHGDEFASNFTRGANFDPYNGDIRLGQGPLVSRRAIARFVDDRYSAGDGWTVSQLLTPQGDVGLPFEAVYGLRFTITYPGGSLAGGSKVVVACSSGLVSRWVGPAFGRTHG
ncbi:MAG: hypothetical protein M3P15_01940 [Actinomycetota bacterium]|nr:hypothetical protein [Actinomycetota bacterium]